MNNERRRTAALQWEVHITGWFWGDALGMPMRSD